MSCNAAVGLLHEMTDMTASGRRNGKCCHMADKADRDARGLAHGLRSSRRAWAGWARSIFHVDESATTWLGAHCAGTIFNERKLSVRRQQLIRGTGAEGVL